MPPPTASPVRLRICPYLPNGELLSLRDFEVPDIDREMAEVDCWRAEREPEAG